jgi:hypothetical protein
MGLTIWSTRHITDQKNATDPFNTTLVTSTTKWMMESLIRSQLEGKVLGSRQGTRFLKRQ